jgi:chitosanase
MRNAFAKRVAWAGLLALSAPLGCGNSATSDGPSGGAGASATPGGGAPAGAGAANTAAGDGGSGPGIAGGGAGQGASGSPGSGGSSGAAEAGSPGSGGAVAAGGMSGASAGAGASAGGGSSLGDGSTCDYTDDKQFCACVNASCGGDTLTDKSKMLRSIYCGVCAGGQTCVGSASDAGGAIGSCQALTGLTDAQKAKAAALTSIWENSTPTLAYGYSQDIGDNRGYTSGRAGFCTGTGDAIVVVQCYNAAKPGNALAKFIPELVRLEKLFVSSKGMLQGDISGLVGYDTAWKASGTDPVFMSCQDSVVDAVYYGPALKKANAKGFKSALTTVSLWDAQIMHGESDPSFGTVAMIAMADKVVTLSNPPTAMEESTWLGAFHKIRAQIMTMHKEWKGNIYRVATYEQLRVAGNMDFTGCVKTGSVSASTYWTGLPTDKADTFNVCDK